ncbi:MAG TPA: alpha/beta fold hydrolase [Gaiellaceae bacterium]|nr:alpha/beta fold hydrolase [Gaiellaceae bacterium]
MDAATLMPGFRPHVADIGGVRTRYWVGGEGPPLLLVHGLGGASYNFTELAPLLAERRRVLVPDLPGHCGTEPLPALEHIADLAGHVRAVAEQEGMLPAAVLGYSLGGVVALRCAVARPADVSALVLVAPAGIVSTTQRARTYLAVVGALKPGRVAARFRGALARRPVLRYPVFGYWGAADPSTLSPEGVLGLLEGPPRHTDVGAAGRALLRDDPRQDLDRVRCPTVLVWGARDRLVPLVDGFEYARRLRCAIRTVPAAGHLVVAEYPELCADVVGEFLDRVGEVDELPLEPELVGEPGGQRTDP